MTPRHLRHHRCEFIRTHCQLKRCIPSVSLCLFCSDVAVPSPKCLDDGFRFQRRHVGELRKPCFVLGPAMLLDRGRLVVVHHLVFCAPTCWSQMRNASTCALGSSDWVCGNCVSQASYSGRPNSLIAS